MSDILKFLHDYPDDISLVMSKARVLEIIAEIERLQSELAGALEDAEELNVEVEHYANLAIVDLGANPTVSWKDRAESAEAERDALREALKPFALISDTGLVGSMFENGDDDMKVLVHHASGTVVTLGDLRRASAALKGDDRE